MTPVSIAVAGSIGAVSRFVLDGHIRARYNRDFPWATLVINVSGSLVLGIVSGILLKHHGFTNAEAIIGTGFCGGYTTFSTASFETVRLLEERRYASAFGNAAGGIIATIIAAAFGIAIGRLL
jgi:CrcB protein